MTTFADVKVGAWVRLTGNGEVHEFVVQASQHRPSLTDSGYRYYNEPDSWEVEILQKPLPTGEYAVIGSRKSPTVYVGFYYEGGCWKDHEGDPFDADEIQEKMKENPHLEVLFDGIQK